MIDGIREGRRKLTPVIQLLCRGYLNYRGRGVMLTKGLSYEPVRRRMKIGFMHVCILPMYLRQWYALHEITTFYIRCSVYVHHYESK